MGKTDIKTITYDTGFRNFMVDVVETEFGYEAYIYKSTIGVKDLMFGLQEKNLDYFLEVVEANLPIHMQIYEEEYNDCERSKMEIKKLNELLHKYMWVYERDEGDKGFVIALNEEDAINKLAERYNDTRERIAETDKDPLFRNCMYLYHAENAEIYSDIFVTCPW